MTTKELTVGTRVRLRSACGDYDTGTVTRPIDDAGRVEVLWDSGQRATWRADALVRFSPPSGSVPPSERIVVDDTTRELLS